jgi:hypothetical protein
MSLTVVKEGNILRVLSASEVIPDGEVLRLVTARDHAAEPAELCNAELSEQMPAFIRGDKAEAAEELF